MSSLRRVGLVLGALVGLLLAVVVAAFVAGLSIDGARWREAIAQHASDAMGRPVALQGALRLTLGRELQLRVGELRVQNPPGFSSQEFLQVGGASLRFDLLDALRGLPRLRSIEASDIGLWLERAADGRGNWALAQPREPADTQRTIDLGRITLSRLAIRYHDVRSATRRAIALDEVDGSAGPNEPLRLALRGRANGQWPYLLQIDGGALRLLQAGHQPWPFRVDLKAPGASLRAGGELDTGRGEARFHLNARVDDLAGAGAVLGAALPQAGAAAVSGFVVANAETIALSPLQGALGESEFAGQLSLALGGARPRLSGALSMAAFDLRPFLEAGSPAAGTPAEPGTPARQPALLRDGVPLDLELELRVGRWLGLPIGLRDTKFGLHADSQGLRAPIHASLTGAELVGGFELNTAASTPTFAFRLAANDLALGSLVRDLMGEDGVEGRVGQAELRLAARGDTFGALLRDAQLSLALAAAKLSYASASTARPISVAFDKLKLAAGPTQPLRGSADGSLMGERARLLLRGGTLPDLLGERATPVDLEIQLAEATLRLEAALADVMAASGTALRFDLQARRSGDLARWLPVAAQSQLPVALRGRVRLAQDSWQLDDTTLRLGHSQLKIDARRALAAGRHFTTATLRSPLIDAAELATLRPSAEPRDSATPRLDAPILAAAIELDDADLDLEVQQLRLGRADLVDVGFIARTREGRLLPSTVSGKIAGTPFNALAELDLSGELPRAQLDLSTGAIDIGALLRGLGLAEDIDGRADRLQLTLRGHGNSLRELADNTAFDAYLVGGSLTVLGAAQRPVTEIRLREALVGAAAGQPLRMRLDGTLDQTAVRIQLSTGSFADFAGDATRVPFAMTAQAAGARLSLDGEVTLPLGSAGRLTLEMSGEQLDSLSELARVELPAWGPWSLRGPLRMTATGYEVQGLTVGVGHSRLQGSGTLDISGPRPRLQVQVAAPTLQLDDFPMPQHLADPPEPPRQGEGLRGTATQLAGRVDRLLSARFLRRFDASLDVQADEVLSGADRLASGALQLKLQDGRLDLDPALVNLPGGRMHVSMSYDLKESVVDFQVAAQIERFDYGIIARRLDRADRMRGLFSMNLALSGTAPSLDSIMRNANGKLDFAVWPTELRSGRFNLWSANLLLTLLPLIDPGLKSQVNCIVGRFDLKDGDLSDDKILIDTTTVRIRGAGHANLRTEELDFIFRPRAKGLGLFRLQTPLRVDGTLNDQRFHFDQQDVFFSVLRLIASPILVPIEWLVLGPQPHDGADVCTDPLRVISP